jgi:hypothetical protein
MSTTIPPKIGRYDVVKLIGQGGMGAVYEVRAAGSSERLALKVVLDPEPLLLERLKREGRTLLLIGEHPHHLRLRDTGEEHGRPFLVMDLLPGGTLKDRVRDGPLDEAEAARILVPIARAVHFLHELGIIHRDLKPSNILFDAEGRPRVADLGLAKSRREQKLTETGAVLGSMHYMAPEQANAEGELGPGADVWSLGAILFRIVTGTTPFEGEGPALAKKILLEEPQRARAVRPALSKEIDAICAKALCREPERRYPSAEALAQDLERFVAGQPLLWAASRSWGPSVVTGALAALLVAASVASAIALRRVGRERDDVAADLARARAADATEIGRAREGASALAGTTVDDGAVADLARAGSSAERAKALVAAARRAKDREVAARLVEAALVQDDATVLVDLPDEARAATGKILAEGAHAVLANKDERDHDRLARARFRLFRARLLAPSLDLREDARALRAYLRCRGRADLALVARPFWWVDTRWPAALDRFEDAPPFDTASLSAESGPPEFDVLRESVRAENASTRAKLDAFTEALVHRPEVAILWVSIGNEAIVAGDHAVAVRCMKEWAARARTPYSRNRLGDALLHIGRAREAAVELEAGWEGSKGPHDCDGYGGLGYAYACFALNDWERLDRVIDDVKHWERDKLEPTQPLIDALDYFAQRADVHRRAR